MKVALHASTKCAPLCRRFQQLLWTGKINKFQFEVMSFCRIYGSPLSDLAVIPKAELLIAIRNTLFVYNKLKVLVLQQKKIEFIIPQFPLQLIMKYAKLWSTELYDIMARNFRSNILFLDMIIGKILKCHLRSLALLPIKNYRKEARPCAATGILLSPMGSIWPHSVDTEEPLDWIFLWQKLKNDRPHASIWNADGSRVFSWIKGPLTSAKKNESQPWIDGSWNME